MALASAAGGPLGKFADESIAGEADRVFGELAAAKRILGSKNGSRDITRAVKLLWVAVQKGNSAAGLTLSDLYLRGQVVAKNCAQVRVLLTAAARKGSAEAKARFEQLSAQGCP